MKPLNLILAASGAAFASLCVLASPVVSAPPQTRSVQQEAALAKWQAETTQALDRLLAAATAPRLIPANTALVEVAFAIGNDGMARDIELLEGRGNWSARRAALYAVSRLDTLARIPVADPGGTRLVAYLIFYRSMRARERLLALARERALARKAKPGKYFGHIAVGHAGPGR